MKIKIPEWEMEFRADRSSGPGGQNVNKTATKVTLKFGFDSSKVLNTEQKALIRKNLSGYINKDGEVVLSEQGSRSQWINRQTVILRLQELVNEALIPEKERKKTKVSEGVKIKVLEAKKMHSLKKKMRGKVEMG